MIKFKDLTNFLNRRQYPINSEAREGLQKIITLFLNHGLLLVCNSPCNTSSLPVRKKDATYRLVRNLRAVNEAIIPIHPVVPNPYIILGQIPSQT